MSEKIKNAEQSGNDTIHSVSDSVNFWKEAQTFLKSILPEDFQDEFSKYSRFTSDICFIVTKLIDKLFEKIVDHLRNEGILLRTKEVALGAPK